MQKIVINACYGGFGLSPLALQWMYNHGATSILRPAPEYYGVGRWEGAEKQMTEARAMWEKYITTGEGDMFLTVFTADGTHVLSCSHDMKRDDPLLIHCVEALGEKANGRCAALHIVEIPDGVQWCIEEYDGNEHVAEQHRTWS